MVAFIDAHREAYGVEPICDVIAIAPSTYDEAKARQADPTRRACRAPRDDTLRAQVQRVWKANRCVSGARKVWRQLGRERPPDLVQRQFAATRPNIGSRGYIFALNSTGSSPKPSPGSTVSIGSRWRGRLAAVRRSERRDDAPPGIQSR
jgi:hypothetical protein